MTSYASHAGRAAVAAGCLLLTACPTHAHAIIGDRLFPATLAIDDPGVTDELSLPTFTRTIGSDGTREHDYGFEIDKTIVPGFEIIVGDTYSRFSDGTRGLQNLEIGAKYQLYGNAPHEVLVAVGVSSEIGGTGASAFSDKFSTIGPQVYFGKGFGDLPTSLDALRPFAVTGQVGLGIPTQRSTVSFTPNDDGTLAATTALNATSLNWGFSLQYSLVYLNQSVKEIAGPEFLRHLIPTVEVALVSPIANVPDGGHTTLGTVNPGVFYEGDKYQLGLEAVLPINEASGKHPGLIAQLHFFLDDIFPNSIGRPIFPGVHP